MVAHYASTHRVLVQYHGVSKFVHLRVSYINYTTSTPKGVTIAPFFYNSVVASGIAWDIPGALSDNTPFVLVPWL